MTTYLFADESPIREAALHITTECEPSALLYANNTLKTEQLLSIRKSLEAKGWLCVPVNEDGRSAVQVSGFKDENELMGNLRQHNFVSDVAQLAEDKTPHHEAVQQSFFKRYSLKLAGALNMIGDVGLLTKGLSGGNSMTSAAGGFYTIGGANLAVFGNAKPTRSPLTERMATFIGSKIDNPSEHPGLSELIKGAPAKKKLNEHMAHHAANVTLGAYSLGAATMLAQGIGEFRDERAKLKAGAIDPSKTKGWSLIGYGISSLTFKLVSLLIPEKSPEELEEDKKKGGVWNKCKNWVREKPMRLFGYGSLITDTFLAVRAFQEYQVDKALPVTDRTRKDYLWTALLSVAYMASDFLAAISSKRQQPDKLDAEEERGILALAAETIALQPKEKQAALTTEVASYLEGQPEVKTRNLRSVLERQVNSMKDSPWALRVQNAPVLEASR